MSHVRNIDCSQAVARLYEYLDREGSDASIEEVEHHLELCRRCCSRFNFEITLWTVVRSKAQEVRCPESLKMRVKDLLTRY